MTSPEPDERDAILVAICKNTGLLAEDCGGNFTCDNGCPTREVEFVPVSRLDQAREEGRAQAREEIVKRLFAWTDCQTGPTIWALRRELEEIEGEDG